jgi:hypothetical protein
MDEDGIIEPREHFKGLLMSVFHLYGMSSYYIDEAAEAAVNSIFSENNLHNLLWMITEIQNKERAEPPG